MFSRHHSLSSDLIGILSGTINEPGLGSNSDFGHLNGATVLWAFSSNKIQTINRVMRKAIAISEQQFPVDLLIWLHS